MLPASDGWERFHPLSPLFSAGRLIFFGLLIASQQLPPTAARQLIWIIALGGALLAALAGAYAYVAWRHTGYRIRDDRLEIRRGILFKSQGDVPLPRIESVDVGQKALPRLFGLAEVNVEVASQGGGEAHLKYLSLADAEELRVRLDRLRRHSEPDAPAAQRLPLAAVADRDLLFAYGAVPALALLVTLSVMLVVLATAGLQALLAFGVFAIVVVVGSIGAQLRRVDRLYGFRLSRDEEQLHIDRGYVEKLTQQIPMERIQAIRMEEPWLWRFFGRARLQVSVAGYRGSAGQRADAMAILMPVARREEVLRLVTTLGGPSAEGLELTSPPESARWRSPIRWKHTGIGHAPGFTVVRRGWLRRQVDFVTAVKLQSLRSTAGPWQRRLGLASLHLDTAGPGISISADHLAAEEVLRHLWQARAS